MLRLSLLRARAAAVCAPSGAPSLLRTFHASARLCARVERTFKRRLAPTTAPAVRSADAPPPAAAGAAPGSVGLPADALPPAPGGGGLMGVVAEGFAFGVGSAIARSVVGSAMDGLGGLFGGGDSGGGGVDASPPPPPLPPPADSFEKSWFDDDDKGSGGGDSGGGGGGGGGGDGGGGGGDDWF